MKMKYTISALAAMAVLLSCREPSADPTPSPDPSTPETPVTPDEGDTGGTDEGGDVTGPSVEKTGSRTLVLCYSNTGTTKSVVETLRAHRKMDLLYVEPAEEGLDYEADNYALGDALISKIKSAPNDASSYPAIKKSSVDFSQYDTVVVATPLWWSQMAAPMQTCLFENAASIAGKAVALVVTSWSSGISGVESDLKRLLPSATKVGESLWISHSTLSSRESLAAAWLATLKPSTPTTMNMKITIGGTTVTATLVENTSTAALLTLLGQGPLTYEAHDYGDFEKVGNIGHTLPQNNEDITTSAGDIILYQGTSICLYYDVNNWDFTRLGRIDGLSASEIRTFLKAGEGNVSVTLSL